MSAANSDTLETSSNEQESSFDPREYVRILLAYKWLILGITLVVGSGVILWTVKQAKVYEAACTIEYDPNPSRPLGEESDDANGGFWMNREFYSTQNKIIGSRVVAESVVTKLGLHKNAGFMTIPRERRRAWAGVSTETAAQVLQSRTTIEQLKDTRIVNIRVRDEDAVRAAQLSNAIADAYIDKMMNDRLGSTVYALEWLSTQLDKVRRDLDASETALFQFRQDENVLDVSMEHRKTTQARIIEESHLRLSTSRARRIEMGAKLRTLRESNRDDPMAVHASMVDSNPSIGSLRSSIQTKIAERESLGVRYGENHPKIRSVDGELTILRNQMRGQIDGLIGAAEAELREAQNIESSLQGELERQSAEGHSLNQHEIEYNSLLRARENNSKLYGRLLERTTETDLTRLLRVAYVRLLDRALTPQTAVSPRFAVNAAAGVGAGLALGLLFAFALTKLDRRIRSVEEAEALGLTILGILPAVGDTNSRAKRKRRGRNKRSARVPTTQTDLVVHMQPQSSAAECCRTIRTNLAFMSADKPIRAILVTSSSPAEGKTTVAVSLATSLAQSGKRVLLVDSDLRRPRIHRTFGISGASGVTSVLVGEKTLQEAAIPTVVPNLDVLPCGPTPPNPAELLHSSRFRDLLNEALSLYDRVVFDSPPLGAVTDAAILAPQLDTTILVVKSQQTTRDAITSALRQLRDVKARFAGGILNDVDLTGSHYGYGYGSYYYYYRREGYYTSDAELAAHGETRLDDASVDEAVSSPPDRD